MGAIGAILAGAADPRVAAVVATSAPADPYRLTRQTFRLARLPIPDPIAYPLAWLTTRVYLAPRGHRVAGGQRPRRPSRATADRSCSPTATTTASCRRAPGPAGGGRRARARGRRADAAPVETLVVPGGQHSWLYEDPGLPRGGRRGSSPRRSAARSRPTTAAAIAAATPAERIPDGEDRVRGRRGHARRLPHARRRSRCPGATAGPGPARRPAPPTAGARPWPMPDDEPGLGRDRVAARRSAVRRPAARRGAPRAHPARRPPRDSSKNQQRWAFIVCRDREPPAGARPRSGRAPATSPARPSAIALVTPGSDDRATRRCRSCSTSARPPTR